jgi:general secretion pathway protein E/type IV pilus assembly protein PilB
MVQASDSMEAERAPAAASERIGDRLVQLGLITADQLSVALHEKQRSNKMLGTILVDFGFISEMELSAILAESSGFEQFVPDAVIVDPEMVLRLPKDVALRNKSVLLSYDDEGKSALVAMADPYDVLAMDQLRRFLPRGTEIRPRVATGIEIAEAIDRFYGYELSIDGILAEMSGGDYDPGAAADGGEEGYTHPVVRLVNAMLFDAVKVGASDLHFEPEESFVRLRYRVDGVMRHIRAIHRDHWPAVSHRLKILAGMNIADKLMPQDGRFSMTLGNREIDFRVSSMPTAHGENIVLRVLDKTKSLRHLPELGFSPKALHYLQTALKRPEGIVIVTGPTGSGKTTTLYAMLEHMSAPTVNIMTLEDPIEYQLPGIRQTQIREAAGLTFSEGVRSVLRQDPDIIFIGEVRDAETAQMALRAAMTGHQVFTTLHTNDALGAVSRLFDLDLHPGLLAGNIIMILAQRLARRLCDTCKTPRQADPVELKILGAEPGERVTVHDAAGCTLCGGVGYRGRIALVEVLTVDDRLDNVIGEGGTRGDMQRAALESGFQGLAEDGAAKVRAGIISIDSLIEAVDLTRRM